MFTVQDFQSMFNHFPTLCMKELTLHAPTQQNDQTHSNNPSTASNELFESV